MPVGHVLRAIGRADELDFRGLMTVGPLHGIMALFRGVERQGEPYAARAVILVRLEYTFDAGRTARTVLLMLAVPFVDADDVHDFIVAQMTVGQRDFGR